MWGEVSFGNRIDSREPLFRVIEQRPHVELVALGSKLLIFCAKPLSDEDFHSLEASLTRETSLQAHLAHWSSLRCWIEREQNNQRLKNVAEAIILEASRRKPPLRIGTAESCTGGLVGHLLTTIPGSSAVFQGGIASYSNELKARLLGVDPLTIERVGAVSAETAQAMAKGARDALSVDVAVSVTGIAGPSGGTPEKPVGLVFVGCSIDDRTWSVECRFDPSLSRTDIQERSACRALELLHEALRSIRH
jgi:PncC family amidohydrolase